MNGRILCRIVSLGMMLAAPTAGFAAVVDRIALVVGKTVFTQSEVDDEVRVEALESGKPLTLSGARRKEAADRLVDQELLRQEMSVTGFPASASDDDALLRKFRQEHFTSIPLYRAALTKYAVSEAALKKHLAWEVAVVRFTDQRFMPLIAAAPDAAGANSPANRAQTPDNSVPAAADTVDKEMETWLKQQRANTRIVYKQEAFQ